MATKKSPETLAALNAQIAALKARADELRSKEVAEVIVRIRDAVAHYGLTAADLGFGAVVRKSAKSSAAGGAKPKGTVGKKAVPKPSPRPVKFKDDQGNTWFGMGKRPAWFNAALASGKKPEDLLATG